MISEVKWSKSIGEPLKGPHRDYDINLRNAGVFVNNATKNLLKGMRVYIADSENLPAALLTMCYKPPLTAKRGTFAYSIFLHQECREVSKQIEFVFNSLMQMAQKYNVSEQKDFFDK